MPHILSVVIYFIIFVLFVTGVLLLLQRRVNPKPRICLAVFSIITSLAMAWRLYSIYQTGGVPKVCQVLPLPNLNGGFLVLLLLYLYPIEVVSPGWLNWKRIFKLFLPWFILNAIILVVPIQFRTLHSFSEILQYIGEFNVQFRLLILFVCIVPYTVMMFRIPYKWQRNSVSSKWIYKYVVYEQVVGLLFCTFMLTGSVAVNSVHLVYGMIFCLYVTYQELFMRLYPMPSNETDEKSSVDTAVCEVAIKPVEVVPTNQLWDKLTVMMDQKSLWSEPDITLNDLTKQLYTNRTTLLLTLQQHGYTGYTEFINRRRIEAFVEGLENGHPVNIQELFYDVGFRSKSTALRNFRLYMGCTPSEYIHRKGLGR